MFRVVVSVLVTFIIQASVFAEDSITLKSTPGILLSETYKIYAFTDDSGEPVFDPALEVDVFGGAEEEAVAVFAAEVKEGGFDGAPALDGLGGGGVGWRGFFRYGV